MRDRLFESQEVTTDFVFDKRVAFAFDDMIQRSVPCYGLVVEGIVEILSRLAQPGELVVDVGCSTGTTLRALASDPRTADLRLVGIDRAAPMVEAAIEKAAGIDEGSRPQFICQDGMDASFENAAAVIVNYTLQFVRPPQRLHLLRKLRGFLRPGGCLLLSEKTILDDPQLNRVWIDIHHEFKRIRGYSEVEISRKRESLENVLVPFTAAENRQLLLDAGFEKVELFLSWFNWHSMLAINPGG